MSARVVFQNYIPCNFKQEVIAKILQKKYSLQFFVYHNHIRDVMKVNDIFKKLRIFGKRAS